MLERTVSIDIEAYENDQMCVLEIGLAVKIEPVLIYYRLHPSERLVPPTSYEYRHLIIQEHVHLHNGFYVADNRDNFLFGDSEVVASIEAARIVDTVCSQASSVVFHTANRDMDWLDSIVGVNTTTLPHVIDTQDLARELDAPLGLGKLVAYLGLTCRCLHNAGNDAFYTLQVYFELRERLETM